MRPLATARWTEVDHSARELLVIPIGSLEQHGPHLPMDTDARIASAVATHIHAQLPEVGLAPVISIGASGEHAAFPGTLSIGTPALQALVVELVRHAATTWRHIMFVNGHGGNAVALQNAERLCSHEGRKITVHHLAVPDGDAHAGHTETCLMLHLAPQDVLVTQLEQGNITPIAQILPELRTMGVRPLSANGVLGDPTHATAAEGAQIFSAMVGRAVAVARGLSD